MPTTPDPLDPKITVDKFDGIHNLSQEWTDQPDSLREAVNIDIDRQGNPSTRAGRTLLVACTQGNSLWSDPLLPFALYVDHTTMHAVFQDMSTDVVQTGMAPGLDVSYALVNGNVLWSNGLQSGVVAPDFECYPWACPQPGGQPLLALMANAGELGPGTVQVAITFVDRFGRESGSTLATSIDVDGTNAVILSNIPQPADPSLVPQIRVYATAPGGEVLERAGTIAAGTTTYVIGARPTGRAMQTQFLQPLPPGQIVRRFNGRQIVARGNLLLWSPALRYGLYDPAKHFTRFPTTVDAVEPVGEGTNEAGLYVAAGDRTYYLDGTDPATWKQAIKYPYGIIPGSSAQTPAEHWGIESKERIPAWLAKNGLFCVGLSRGQVVSFKAGEAVASNAEAGASLFREINGIRQFLTALRAPLPLNLKIGDVATAVTYNHES